MDDRCGRTLIRATSVASDQTARAAGNGDGSAAQGTSAATLGIYCEYGLPEDRVPIVADRLLFNANPREAKPGSDPLAGSGSCPDVPVERMRIPGRRTD